MNYNLYDVVNLASGTSARWVSASLFRARLIAELVSSLHWPGLIQVSGRDSGGKWHLIEFFQGGLPLGREV